MPSDFKHIQKSGSECVVDGAWGPKGYDKIRKSGKRGVQRVCSVCRNEYLRRRYAVRLQESPSVR